MNRKYIILGIMGAALIGLIATIFLMPVSLAVKINKDMVYEGEDLTKKDITVWTETITGRQTEISNYQLLDANDSEDIMVSRGRLSKQVHINSIKISSIDVSTSQKIYQGDTFDPEKVSLSVTYTDGHKIDVIDFTCDFTGQVDSKKNVTVKCLYGGATLVLDPIKAEKVEAIYELEPHQGDEFVKDALTVKLHFSDGTTRDTANYTMDDIGLIQEDTNLRISTPFGDTSLELKPVKVKKIKAKYADKIYEGDLFNPEAVTVTVIYEDKEEITARYKYRDPGPIKKEVKIPLYTDYGDTNLTLKPLKVTQITSDGIPDDLVAGGYLRISSFVLTYEDGTERTVKTDEISVEPSLNDPVKAGDNNYEFEYNNMKYAFAIKVDTADGSASAENDVQGDITDALSVAPEEQAVGQETPEDPEAAPASNN